MALLMILQRYTFALSPAYVHSPIQIMTSRPQHGVKQCYSHFEANIFQCKLHFGSDQDLPRAKVGSYPSKAFDGLAMSERTFS
ncbi:hypothetical protein PanWU01x14_009830 [Parasponia andersonii]|uniref:Uncharacterized protein n=1 Tax=Parasponia andersonii TaxID=3476 RepID=A0A2P5E2J2_PARAD|nr:hypothetical protein PanWU01x14_009830 [Parasponia andersonii]